MPTLDETMRALVREEVRAALALERKHPDKPVRLSVSPEEAAQMLGCSADSVRNMVKRGELPRLELGIANVMIPVAALERIAADCAAGSGGKLRAVRGEVAS